MFTSCLLHKVLLNNFFVPIYPLTLLPHKQSKMGFYKVNYNLKIKARYRKKVSNFDLLSITVIDVQ